MPPAPLIAPSAHRPLVLHAATAAGLLMAMAALAHLIGVRTAPWLAASIATALMVRLTVAMVTRAGLSPDRRIGPTLGWSMAMGVANTPVAFVAASIVTNAEPSMIPMAFVATVMGAHLGLGLGLMFGLLLCVPVAMLMRTRRHPSADASDTLLLGVGVWLAAVALLSGLIGPPVVDPLFPMGKYGVPFRSPVLPMLVSISTGLGSLLALAAGWRRAARRRWVAAVARGELDRWRITEAPALRQGLDALPGLGGSPPDCDHLLCRSEDPGQGAYRRAETGWPVAWVPRSWIPTELTPPG